MKRPIVTSFLTVAAMLALLLAAHAQTQLRGTWEIERAKEKPGKIYMSLTHGKNHQSGDHFELSELKGLDEKSMDGTNTPVKFQLVREAGAIDFEGTFDRGVGRGDFHFAANPEFIAKMKKQGFDDVEEKAFALATINVTTAYVAELRSLGFKPSLDEVISGRIFNVGREQVEGLKTVGITGLPMEKLVELRIFNVTPEYVRQMRAKTPNISVEKMVESRIFQVTPEFTDELAKAGYKDLSQEQLVAFKIHGVTPKYINEMRELGYKDLSADQLVEFRIFNVGAEQIQDLSKEGYSNLSASQLVAFRIHKIDSAFIERAKKAGYPHPTPDQLVELKIMGFRGSQADI